MNYPFQHGYNAYPNYQQQSNVTWVQGIEGAKAYPVGAGNTMLLMDSETQVMFIKSADQSGIPNLRVFDYKERTGEEARDMSFYVTRKEFDELVASIKKVDKKKKRLVEEEDDDE